MADSTAVDVRGLRKRYGPVTALDGVDLTVAYGEILALLGPNGAGKTSVMEILAGYRRRDGGEVRVLGEDPQWAGHGWRYGLGIVAQDYADLAELTVGEAVAHFARYYPTPHDPAQVIGLVGLADKTGARVRTLSGGQRRRLDVAIGVIGNPRLLLLDEPTTGFDPQARRQFWELIRSLPQAHGTTVLLTTHYLVEAEALADRVAVISGGRVIASGDPATLGGRAEAHAVVRWHDGDRPRVARVDDPGPLVGELITRYGGSVPGLTVARPTLEDVYLDLIGGARP